MRSNPVILKILRILQLTKSDAVGISLAVLIPIAFALSYIRNYAPLTEGWWHVYGTWLLEGKIPYRDFELLVPPLYPSLIALSQFLGLGDFLVLRYLGLLLIAFIALGVYFLLRPFVRGLILGLLTGTVVVYLQMGAAYISYDYVYVAILFLLLTFIPAAILLTSRKELTAKTVFIASALAGTFAALSFLTKQTNGLVSLFFGLILSVYLVTRSSGTNYGNRTLSLIKNSVVPFAIGAGVVGGAFFLVLLITGSLSPAVSDLSSAASDTKGGLVHSLFSWAKGFLAFDALTNAIRLVLPPITFLAVVSLISQQVREYLKPRFSVLIPSQKFRTYIYWFIAAIFGILFAILGLNFKLEISTYLSQIVFLPIILVSLVTALAVLIGKANPAYLPVSLASLALIWASGMSAGLGETAMFLGVGQAAVLILGKVSPKVLALGLAILIATSTISTGWQTKSTSPFNWWGLATPTVSEASVQIPEGLQKGLLTSPQINEAILGINGALSAVSSCPGEIVEFPHVPLFLLNHDEIPAGRLATYWLDFSSTKEIGKEISRLEDVEIKGLVLVQMPEFVWDGHEQLFAGGKQLEHEVLYKSLLMKAEEMSFQGKWEIGKDYSISVFTSPCN